MNTDKNTALYEKMAAEQDKFRDWLKSQPPEEILKHTYEYTVRKDILMAMEELDLPQSRAAALLASPSPLADVYKEFSDRETSYMDVVRDSIEQRAEAALDAQRELPLYRHDAAHAREQGDLDLYRASRRANIACKEAIEAAISEHYRDNRLDKDAVPQVIEQFGYTRTLYVLANTVQQKDWNERFSPTNKAWAKTVDIPPNPDGFGGERNLDFVVDSHSGLVDLFLSQARQDYLLLQPLTPEEIRAEAARLLQELRAPDTPNSPHGTHYMARVSPDFLARAGTQAHDQLMALLPFRSLAITGMKDLPGTYVTILASAQRELPLYRHDAAHAREQGDLDLYRASRRANIACKEAIEAAISEHYRDNRLDKDAVPQVIEQFGYTRTLYVLANTVQQKDWNERFSPTNKAWAKTVDIPPNPDGFGGERNLDFVVDSHSGLVDLFLSQARQDYLLLQPLTPEEIRAEAARLLQELRAPDTPNSPHGTHYMARVSPDFLARAGTQAHDQLMALLPFRSLAITGMKDLPGTYVTILASEDRSKELCQRRRSVCRQLKQEPRSTEKPEKKSPFHKKKEPER